MRAELLHATVLFSFRTNLFVYCVYRRVCYLLSFPGGPAVPVHPGLPGAVPPDLGRARPGRVAEPGGEGAHGAQRRPGQPQEGGHL